MRTQRNIHRLICFLAVAGAGLIAYAAAPNPAAAPAAASPVAAIAQPFDVYPANINLESSRDIQSIVVRIVNANGISLDVTQQAQYAFAQPNIAAIDKAVVKPLADGTTQLNVTYNGSTVAVPVTVKDAKNDRPISFKLDVMPVFMRSGCNTGGCHGAARGKDGFRISLFGFDPDGDYTRLTREQPTRRINLAIPEDSLLLTKSTGVAQHTGGKRFAKESEYYATIMRWLDAGAPQDSPTVATPVSLELFPKQMVLEGEGATHKLTARAKYSDGTDRDVTSLVVFLSNNDNSAKVSEDGLITAGKRGEAFVMARFATFTVGSQAIVIPKDLKYTWPSTPENNYIDTLVNAKLKKLRITPSQVCSDEVFLRRACIDITGVLPTTEDYDRFMKNPAPNKRELLVDELLSRKEFVEMWVMKWAELLQIKSNNDRMSYKATLLYYNWLQERIANNVPFDKIVQELLGATGGTFTNPATNYYQVETDVLKVTENVAQVFMGMRIQCAQCHNHPFDRWTMNDYYGFVSFFTQVARKGAEDPREVIISNSGGGEYNHPIAGKPMPPKFLGGEEPKFTGKEDRREVMAKWLASPQNPYFARNLGNLVWAHFLGKGIIDQVDDVRISNPAVNPELLDALAEKFTGYNYDFKRLVRDICTSRAYQLAPEPNELNVDDTRNFSHAAIRRIRAEVLLDCINQVTETKEKFRGLPTGARAVQIADGQTSTYFLTTFGRATRETVCSCEVIMEPNLSQALHLINGDTVQQKVTAGGLIKKMLDAKKTPEQIVEDLYMRCFSRKPLPGEMAKLQTALAKEPNKQMVLEDIFWALLNSQEFIFNH